MYHFVVVLQNIHWHVFDIDEGWVCVNVVAVLN